MRPESEPQIGKHAVVTRKDQVSVIRLKNDHHPDQKYWLHKIGRALDTVCRKCGIGEEIVEHTMEECPLIHYLATQLPDPYLIATTPSMPWSCGTVVPSTLIVM